LLTEPEIY